MTNRGVGVLLLVLVFCLLLVPVAAAEPVNGRVYLGNLGPRPLEFAPDRVVVKFAESVSDAEAQDILRGIGARTRMRAWRRAFQVLSVPRGRVWQTVQALQRNPRVRYAHPDWIVHATFVPDDPGYRLQWHLDNPDFGGIQMESAWDAAGGGSAGVTVAVIDSGIAYEDYGRYCMAPDLQSTRFAPGYDFVNNDSHPNDDNGHGTHVAGTIAQSTHNGEGVAGVAHNVTLMPVKVLNADGSGYSSWIAAGIRWAADNGADVINMSFGSSTNAWNIADAVAYAHERGVVLVASSGNESSSNPLYPARLSRVIAVGATRYNQRLTSYSNRGNEICAPGGENERVDLDGDRFADPLMVLQNTFDPNTRAVCDLDYWYFAGTSMAAPHVAGAAALMRSVNPDLTNEEIRTALRQTALHKDIDGACGYGLLNAAAAVQAVAVGDTPPEVEIVAPAAEAVVSGTVTVQIAASDYQDEAGQLSVDLTIAMDDEAGADQTPTVKYYEDSGYYEAAWNTGSGDDGGYVLQAQATDSGGNRTASEPVYVEVNNDNEAPAAAFSVTCTNNTCEFDASGSSDPDGGIIAYDWDFGDGAVAGGMTASHTFATVGTYAVTLTVTDDAGATGAFSQEVAIDEVATTVYVSDLDAEAFRIFWSFWGTTVTITVREAGGYPAAGAWVTGVFSDGATEFNCTTDAAGRCFVEGYQWSLRCLTFSVTDVDYADFTYTPALNTDPDGDSDGTRITSCRP